MLTIVQDIFSFKSIPSISPADYTARAASSTASVWRRSAILGSVQLPAPLFHGGALLGLKGYPVAAGPAKSLHREASANEGRYFSRKRPRLEVPTPQTDSSDSDNPRWVEAFEAQLREDPSEETWLAYALEVLQPGTEGEAAHTRVPLMRKRCDKRRSCNDSIRCMRDQGTWRTL